MTDAWSVTGRWYYFEESMNEENSRERRVKVVTVVDQEVKKVNKAEVRRTLKKMKSGKAVEQFLMIDLWRFGSFWFRHSTTS